MKIKLVPAFALTLALLIAAPAVTFHPLTAAAQAATGSTAQDTTAPVSSKDQETQLKNEENANKQRAKSEKAQRKALKQQEKADKAARKAGNVPQTSTTTQTTTTTPQQ